MIDFDEVTLTYPQAMRPTLDRVSLHVGEGDLCLVVGATGSGKSTVLGAINGLVPHFTGGRLQGLSLIHISEPTRRTPISYAVAQVLSLIHI